MVKRSTSEPAERQETGARSEAAEPRSGLRPKLHHVYYWLAAVNLLTVVAGLLLVVWIAASYDRSVKANEFWAVCMADLWELGRRAGAVNAPGNDIFAIEAERPLGPGEIVRRRAELERAWKSFGVLRGQLAEALTRRSDRPDMAGLADSLAGIDVPMEAMHEASSRVFDALASDHPHRMAEAGVAMAAMDRHHAAVLERLAMFSGNLARIQRLVLSEQLGVVRTAQAWEIAIAVLLPLIVTFVALYGVSLAKQMKESARQALEHRDALAVHEAKLRAVLNSALDPIISVDARGTIQAASKSVERVFGWPPEELVGSNVSCLMPEPERARHDAYMSEYARSGVTNILGRTRELTAVRRDGTTVPIEISVARVEVAGRDEPMFTGVIRDITERRRAEEELTRYRDHLEALVDERTEALETTNEQLRLAERLASIGTLAAGLGHDMNNVLFPVRCRLEALASAPLDAAARAELDAMNQSVGYLQQLSDGLRLLALDPDDARTDGTGDETELNRWWDEIRPLFLSALPSEATLEGDIPEQPVVLRAAPHRLTQAMFNLVLNSGSAIAEDGTVRVFAHAEDDHHVRLGVTDDGCGMTEEVRRHALDPFFTTKKRGFSTGLGLALVHSIAKGAGGTMDIESAPGRGTTVSFILEAVVEGTTADDESEPEDRSAAVSLPDRRVATFVAGLLRSAGFEVGFAEPTEPGDAGVWVTSATPAALESARRFVGAGHGAPRHVIVVGDEQSMVEGWGEIGAVLVDGNGGLEAIKDAIGAVSSASSEETT